MLFSIPVNASPDLNQLSQQLSTESGHLQAFAKLKDISSQDQAALLPMFEYLCSEYADRYGSEDMRRFAEVNKFLKNYIASHEITSQTILALLAIKKDCYAKGRKRHHNPVYVLEKISATQRLSDTALNNVIELTAQQITEEGGNNRSNYTPTYLQILKHQTKFTRLPDKARLLAVRSIDELFHKPAVAYPALDILVGQLKYNDQKSEQALLDMTRPGNNTELRRYATDRLVQWYAQQKTLDSFTRELLARQEQEKDQKMQQYYRKKLVDLTLNRQKRQQLSAEVTENILPLAQDNKKQNVRSALLKSYAVKAETAVLNDNELQHIYVALSGSDPVARNDAVRVVLALNDNNNINKKLHEQLIRLFAQHIALQNDARFRNVVLENIPYRNVEKAFQLGKYPDALLSEFIQYANKEGAKVSGEAMISFMQEVYKYQPLPESVVEGIYDLFARQHRTSLRTRFLDLFIRYYRETGYLRIGTLASELGGSYNKYEKEIQAIVAAELQKEQHPEERLEQLYSDTTLTMSARLFFAKELVSRNFDYAVKAILTTLEAEDEKFQQMVWEDFYREFVSHHKLVNKTILFAATKHTNTRIRQVAWQMLNAHGVSTPFLVKWEEERYQQSVLFNLMLWVGAPLSLIICSFLYLKIPGGRRVKYRWVGYIRVFAWVVSTTMGFFGGMVVLFVAGLSHSSVLSEASYRVLNQAFSTVLISYFVVAVLFRVLLYTVMTSKEIKTNPP